MAIASIRVPLSQVRTWFRPRGSRAAKAGPGDASKVQDLLEAAQDQGLGQFPSKGHLMGGGVDVGREEGQQEKKEAGGSEPPGRRNEDADRAGDLGNPR